MGEGGGAEDVDLEGVEEVGDVVGCCGGKGDAVREERSGSVGEGWAEGFCHVERGILEDCILDKWEGGNG